MTPGRVALILISLAPLRGGDAVGQTQDTFDHEKHRKVFPECSGCHAGIGDSRRAVYPAPAICANCHDGAVQETVSWSGPPSRYSNLRFTHPQHFRKSGERLPPIPPWPAPNATSRRVRRG
jgi:hypothetical protein